MAIELFKNYKAFLEEFAAPYLEAFRQVLECVEQSVKDMFEGGSVATVSNDFIFISLNYINLTSS